MKELTINRRNLRHKRKYNHQPNKQMKHQSNRPLVTVVILFAFACLVYGCNKAKAQTVTPPTVTVTNILTSIGAAPVQVATDGYNVFKQLNLTNPIAFNLVGLQNGTGKYGIGLEVNQASASTNTSGVSAGFGVFGIQTDQAQPNGTVKRGWEFFDATVNLSYSARETIPLLNLPINMRIFSGPFASLNGGVLIGEQSGVEGDFTFQVSKTGWFNAGGGVVNCAGAAAKDLKAAMPMAHAGLVWTF